MLTGVIGTIVSYSACYVNGFDDFGRNIFVSTFHQKAYHAVRNPSSTCVNWSLEGCIHNDDIHTFDDVIGALEEVGIDKVAGLDLANNVNTLGRNSTLMPKMVVGDDASEDKTRRFSDILGVKHGLLFSIAGSDVRRVEPKIHSMLVWIKQLGSMNDGIRRLISNVFFQESCSTPSSVTACEMVPEMAASRLFERGAGRALFPRRIPHFDYLSAEQQGVELYADPFQYCHRNYFAILLLASCYLNKVVTNAIQDIILIFQHDYIFKFAFSQSLTSLYPSLYLFYSKYGLKDSTLFNTTVQVFTASSIVKAMSSDGESLRVLPPCGGKPCLSRILISTLNFCLDDMGCCIDRPTDSFLDDYKFSNRRRRLASLVKDFEYAVEENLSAVRVLAGLRDAGVVDEFMSLFQRLQYLDKTRRRKTTHVENDDDMRWLEATNLVLEMDSMAQCLLQGAFVPAVNCRVSDVDPGSMQAMKQQALLAAVSKGLQCLDDWLRRVQMAAGEGSNNDLFFNASSAQCLGLTVPFPGIRRFHVSYSEVSIHVPINRFISRSLLVAAYDAQDLLPALSLLRAAPPSLQFSFVDYPIRALAFMSEVHCGMWRLNGSAPVNLAYNYSTAPISRHLRDADIAAVQVGAVTLGPDVVLALLIDRFELSMCLETPDYFMRAADDDLREYKPALLGELLRVLVHTLSHVPVVTKDGSDELGSAQREGLALALKRELAPLLLGGMQSLSALERVKSVVGGGAVSEALLSSCLEDISVRRESDDKVSLEATRAAYDLFDPEHMHLSEKVRQRALEAVLHWRQQQPDRGEGSEPLPVLQHSALPLCHPHFASLRSLLYRPLLCSLLRRCIEICLQARQPSQKRGARGIKGDSAILSRVVHLVTLQIHCHPDFASALGSGRDISAADPSVAADPQPERARGELELVGLLGDLWRSDSLRGEELYHQGLHWVLRELFRDNVTAREELRFRGVSFTFASGAENKAKAARARARALQTISLQASRFSSLADAFGVDDEEDAMDVVSEPSDEGAPDCMICHQKNDSDVLAYLCFLQPSTAVRCALDRSSDNAAMQSVYRVVALNGCAVYATPFEGDGSGAPIVKVLQQGEHALSTRKAGRWLQISAPVSGWAPLYTSAKDVFLHPVSDLMYNKNGGTRLHASGCGHAMHFKCYNDYTARCFSESINAATSYRNNIAFDSPLGEFTCPLCKAISNAIVPRISAASLRESLRPPQESEMPLRERGIQSLLSSGRPLLSEAGSLLGNRCAGSAQPALARALQVFLDSCDELDELSGAVKRMDRDGKKRLHDLRLNPDFKDVKFAHYLWSSTAYTVLSSVCNRSWLGSGAAEAYRPDSKEALLCTHLLGMTRQLPGMFEKQAVLDDAVLRPLGLLLAGTVVSGERGFSGFRLLDAVSARREDCEVILQHLPYPSAGETRSYDSKQVASVLLLCQHKGVLPHRLWRFLDAPLLTHDLHTIAIAVVSLGTDVQAVEELISLVVLARLAQVMVEPCATRVGASVGAATIVESGGGICEIVDAAVSARAAVAASCGIALPPAAVGDDMCWLVDTLLDSLLPFLEFCCVLKVFQARGEPGGKAALAVLVAALADGAQLSQASKLLSMLKMPDMLSMLQSQEIRLVMCSWAAQYRDTYRMLHDTASPDSPPQHLWIPVNTEAGSSVDGKKPIGSKLASEPNKRQKMDSLADMSSRFDEHLNFTRNNNARDSDLDHGAGDAGSHIYFADEGDGAFDGEYLEGSSDGDDDESMIEDGDSTALARAFLLETLRQRMREEESPDGEGLAQHQLETHLLRQMVVDADLVDGDLVVQMAEDIREGRLLAGEGVAATEVPWRLFGVPPEHATVDASLLGGPPEAAALSSVHSSAPLQGSVSGTLPIYGYNGPTLDLVYYDLSHFGLARRHRGRLVALPDLYTDLYKRTKFCEGPSPLAQTTLDDPALCLLCGAVLNAANRRDGSNKREVAGIADAGECTLHARRCGAGIGVFLLVQRCCVLIMRNQRACFAPSLTPYVDRNGERADHSGLTQPYKQLYFNARRYRRLEELYFRHELAREIVRQRIHEEKIIRSWWY